MPDEVDLPAPADDHLDLGGAPTTLEIVLQPGHLVEIHDSPPAVLDITLEQTTVLEIVEAGPQGPGAAPTFVEEQIEQLVAGYLEAKPAQVHVQLEPASTWRIPHLFGRIPAVTLYSLTGRRIHTDVWADTQNVTVQYPMPTPGIAVLT